MLIASPRKIVPWGVELRHRLDTNLKILLFIAFGAVLFWVVYSLEASRSLTGDQRSLHSPVRDQGAAQDLVQSPAFVGNLGDIGTYSQGEKIEIPLPGPDSTSLSPLANPFKFKVEVTFTGPDGQTVVVPAFYDGNGAGSQDGNVWKVRFRPDAPGVWSFASSSAEGKPSAYQGVFTVNAQAECESNPREACRTSPVQAH